MAQKKNQSHRSTGRPLLVLATHHGWAGVGARKGGGEYQFAEKNHKIVAFRRPREVHKSNSRSRFLKSAPPPFFCKRNSKIATPVPPRSTPTQAGRSMQLSGLKVSLEFCRHDLFCVSWQRPAVWLVKIAIFLSLSLSVHCHT